ncbi:hypothetical protein MYSTI_02503 [Myxococcus stipitatus DSM 14675]|uniref:Pentapeptide repeat-containing protein n=1 Tax=Myxococcus stipitatus (strain DSM 14675 / JCM 12634 / Mx s8) TaxID=1278073 RepID=L7UBH3_MYXSD|nr:pentapeptide repeat-containing protein [Myxococcus stipitatus]AGC43819.1 hypothetical protein MYSTI_02503 [Myxococcus stipitatus DSM 14675]
MSSDCYYVRVGTLEGKSVTLHCLTGFAGGMKDYATTRSFALLLLIDARKRADDTPDLVRGAPKEVAKLRKALAKKVAKARSPLLDEVSWPRYKEDWHAENTPRYIQRVKLLERHNDLHEWKLEKARAELSPLQDKGFGAFLEAAWERMHGFDLQVEVTDAKYLAHLVEGHLFPTTAFDVWSEPKAAPPKKAQEPKGPRMQKPAAAPKGNYAGMALDDSFWPANVRKPRDISGSNFQQANLTTVVRTPYVKALECDFTKAKMTRKTTWDLDTYIIGWKLRGSLFRGASLKDAVFSDCDLSHCDFTGADLRDATFMTNNLKGAIFKGANLKNALIPPEFARQANLEEAKNYSPAPGGAPGAQCRALSRLLSQSKEISFEVHSATPDAEGNRSKLSFGRSSDDEKRIRVYRISLLSTDGDTDELSDSHFSIDVEARKFGSRLREMADSFPEPQRWKLDLSTLTVRSRGAPIATRALKDIVRGALVEIFNES